ncbi:DNA mismatch repair protein MutS [bacterium SCSIO 12643]|nr:DNA mismatch repair protein MutS [bacterium SCSIO 12643]
MGCDYQSRVDQFNTELKQIKTKSRWISVLRLSAFVLIIFGVYQFWGNPLWVFGSVGLGGILFLNLVVWSNRIGQQIIFLEAKLQLNQNEISAVQDQFDFNSDGREYIQPTHEYTNDFDVFGPHSFFQYLNRTVSVFGRNQLAQWLQEPVLNKEAILQRQDAIRELAAKLEWRQDFLASGMMHQLNEKDQEKMKNWYLQKNKIGGSTVYRLVLIALPILTIALFLLALFEVMSWTPFTWWIWVPIAFVGSKLKAINEVYHQLSNMVGKLEVLSKLTEKIEEETFQTELLQSWKAELNTHELPASKKIKALRKLLDMFEQRNNILVGIVLNIFLLWDLNLMERMHQWKSNNALELEEWLNVIAQFDAMISMSNRSFNDGELIYPEVSDEEFELNGQELFHPMLKKEERVGNDYAISGRGTIHIVTGANMAGKSTFLRTVGMNLVLGMIGMPVAAKAFIFSPMKVFSSMRTEDSLASHTSFFYAELSRLARISDMLKEGEKRFVILDEILKGTNSEDKARGSYAFVEKIIGYNMMGIIATHDLSLCKLADQYPERIQNKAFEVQFVKDELQFDYKLRTGVCQNMNASFLLKKMGIVDHY